jgi:hypothetical protein
MLARQQLVGEWEQVLCCSKIAEAEAAVSVNEKKWLVMHMQVLLRLLAACCVRLLKWITTVAV